MISKKGESQVTWFIAMTILIIILLVGYLLYMHVFSKAPSSNVKDSVCRLSNNMRSFSIFGPVHGVTQAAPEGLQVGKISRACSRQNEPIVVGGKEFWNGCSKEFKNEFLNGDATEAVKNCVAQHLAEKIWRCWWMYGEGQWQPDSGICFLSLVKYSDTGASDVVSERNRMKNRVELIRNLAQQARIKLGCVKKGHIGGASCNSIAEKLAEDTAKKMGMNALLEFYKEKITSQIEGCIKKEKYANAREITSAVTDIASRIQYLFSKRQIFNSKYSQKKSQDEISSDLAYNIKNGLNIDKQLREAVFSDRFSEARDLIYDKGLAAKRIADDNFDLSICKGIDQEIFSAMRTIDQKTIEINEIDKAFSDFATQYDLQKEDIELISNATVDIGVELPDLSAIDDSFLINFMSNTIALERNETYGRLVPLHKVIFMPSSFMIGRGTNLEIGFCDPPRPFLSGISAQLQCTNDLFGGSGQNVQIGQAGGVAGISRSDSPYVNLCYAFNMGIVEAARDLCATAIKGLTRPV